MIHLVPISHGVEATSSVAGYADAFTNGIQKYLPQESGVRYIFAPFDWNSEVMSRELYVYECVEKGLMRKAMRKLKHTLGSDVIWYSRTRGSVSGLDIYQTIHAKLSRLIKGLIAQFPGEEIKISGIGHSQGSQIMLDHCFEAQELGYTFEGLFTLGSIVSAKSGCFPNYGSLPKGLKYWVNIYNTLDFVSSRIGGYHPSQEIAAFVRDYSVGSFNPLNWTLFGAHTMYWNSSDVHKIIAAHLSGYEKPS